jgi:Na+-translocating ferredoxin:NAD+ oxidoreductase RNF subunit RnfB
MKALGGGNLAADYREALDYVFSRSFVDSVMLGMSSRSEVNDLLDYLEGKLGEDYVPDVSDKVLKVNHDDCVGCGECMKACASGAIYYGDDGLSVIDRDRCIDCGYCAYACPVRAIIRV